MKDAEEQIKNGVSITLIQIKCSNCKLKIIKEEFRQHQKNCLTEKKKIKSKKYDTCDKVSETSEVEEDEEVDPTALSKIFVCPLLCGGKFLTKDLVKRHLQKFHRLPINAQLALGLNISQIDLKTIDLWIDDLWTIREKKVWNISNYKREQRLKSFKI